MRGLGRLAGAAAAAAFGVIVAAEDPSPAVRIVKLTVDGRTMPPGAIHPPGRGDLAIEYASTEAAEGVRFRYKLEGFDRAWIDAGDRRRQA